MDVCTYKDDICETCSGSTDGSGTVIDNDADDDNTLIHNVNISTAFDVGHIPKEFAINDIAIVYREKSIK